MRQKWFTKRYGVDELWKTGQTLQFVIVRSRDLFFTWGASGGIIHRTHDTINLKATMFWIFPLGDVGINMLMKFAINQLALLTGYQIVMFYF